MSAYEYLSNVDLSKKWRENLSTLLNGAYFFTSQTEITPTDFKPGQYVWVYKYEPGKDPVSVCQAKVFSQTPSDWGISTTGSSLSYALNLGSGSRCMLNDEKNFPIYRIELKTGRIPDNIILVKPQSRIERYFNYRPSYYQDRKTRTNIWSRPNGGRKRTARRQQQKQRHQQKSRKQRQQKQRRQQKTRRQQKRMQ